MKIGIVAQSGKGVTAKIAGFVKALEQRHHIVTGGEGEAERTAAQIAKQRKMGLTYCVNENRFKTHCHPKHGADKRIANIVRESDAIICFGGTKSLQWLWIQRANEEHNRPVLIASQGLPDLLEWVNVVERTRRAAG